MNYVIRTVQKNDVEPVTAMAQSAAAGITSLPKEPELVKLKIDAALKSFGSEIQKPDKEIYLFVIEELESQAVVGISGIFARNAATHPIFFYEIDSVKPKEVIHGMPESWGILKPVVLEKDGNSEIGALFLDRQHRKEGLGKLLSLCRFLFIADHRNRFENTVIANMRGVINPNNVSPFWEGVGRKFCDISFVELMHFLYKQRNKVLSFMPPYPIYISLLPQEIQMLIGTTHSTTAPALNMLLQEGFERSKMIDPFDGGPILSCPTDKIRAICESRTAKIGKIEKSLDSSELYLISNRKIHFRCCIGPIQMLKDGSIALNEAAALALQVNENEDLRYVQTR